MRCWEPAMKVMEFESAVNVVRDDWLGTGPHWKWQDQSKDRLGRAWSSRAGVTWAPQWRASDTGCRTAAVAGADPADEQV
jgi:hypothetical protein